MLVSACLIVRDEARFLPNCLLHLVDFADEVIITDTGSRDSTPDIAREHGARLFEFPWCDDFAAARNFSLQQARGQWILYIDADERLLPAPGAREQLQRPGLVAATVEFRPASHMTSYREHRLFHNRPDLRFQGAIHETILPDLHRIQRDEGLDVWPIDCAIEHDGYEGDLSHKHRRNLPLLESACERDPKRLYLWHALGECLVGLGRLQEAETAFRRGLALLRVHPDRNDCALIFSDLMSLHFELPLHDIEALRTEAEGLAGDPLISWWLARLAMQAGNLEDAKRWAGRLAQVPENEPGGGRVLAWDRRIFGEFLWSLQGNIALLDGDNRQAVERFERCVAADPSNREYTSKLTLARARN
ncbi:MAG: glycosyltransferase family 2 protein [Pseudomonadota bacterium]